MQFEHKSVILNAKATHTPHVSDGCFLLHVLQTHLTSALRNGPLELRTGSYLRCWFLPLLAVISARESPTHCKTKTTPTRRSNVFTPAISKFRRWFCSQYPGVRLPHAPTPLPRGLRNSPASPAAFKTETCLRCTELLFVPACATLRAPGECKRARLNRSPPPKINKK